LFDAADRWRQVAVTLAGAPSVAAGGRAALAACLVGDLDAAARDLIEARRLRSGSAPRGVTALLDGVDAAMEAVRGGFDRAARRLTGLAAATVPVDPMAAERWNDLAVTVVIAGGDDRTAHEMPAAQQDGSSTTRRRMLTARLHLRAGRLSDARNEIAAASGAPILRRDAVLAAAVTIGLARRAGDQEAVRATWRRIAPVVAGADVEPLLLDAWGELSAGAACVSARKSETIVEAMTDAVRKAGTPSWCTAVDQWWRLQRAVVVGDAVTAANAAEQLSAVRVEPRAAAVRAWASVLAGPRTRGSWWTPRPSWRPPGSRGRRPRSAAARRDRPIPRRPRNYSARPCVPRQDRAGNTGGGLSKRERAVAELLVDGLTHKAIGARLHISPKTVEQHVAKLARSCSCRTAPSSSPHCAPASRCRSCDVSWLCHGPGSDGGRTR
jgi:ATP/maltotriose-dependent transcriptional regulator MalT